MYMRRKTFIGADLEILKLEAIKYDSRTAFFKGSRSAYKECLKRYIMDEVCHHMVKHNALTGSHGNCTLSNDYLIELAKSFEYRGKLKEAHPSAYRAIRVRGLSEIAFAHMKVSGNKFNRRIYVFEHSDNTAYIGLSYEPEKRRDSHLKYNKTLIEKSQKTIQSFKILTDWLTPKDASKQEEEFVAQYLKSGWIILNKAKAGALGGGLKWTKEKCFEIASQCLTKVDFSSKNPSAYNSARKMGWLEELCKHMVPSRVEAWKFQELFDIAIQCSTKYGFKKKNPGAYKAARKMKILDEICAHMPKDCRNLPRKDRPSK